VWVPRIFLVSMFLPLACSTAYHARPSEFANEHSPTNEGVVHCLRSIGLVDESTEEWNARFISQDPKLVAIWSTRPGSFWSTKPGCTAAIRLESGAQHVVFVPFSGSTSGAAQALSDAFEHCVELHASETDIEVESETFIDFR
jgi:hypothetical protein